MQRANRQEAVTRGVQSESPGCDDKCSPNGILMPNPRTLHQLWDECPHGIGNNKAAKCFIRAERGRYKHKCSRREIVWELISSLVRPGDTAFTI